MRSLGTSLVTPVTSRGAKCVTSDTDARRERAHQLRHGRSAIVLGNAMFLRLRVAVSNRGGYTHAWPLVEWWLRTRVRPARGEDGGRT